MILHIFEMVSVMMVNLSKCSMARVNFNDEMRRLADLVGCSLINWVLFYLGVVLGVNPCSTSFWNPMIAGVEIVGRLE